MTGPFRILVLCTGNSARSQIAEALLTVRGAHRLSAESAGTRPAAEVNRHAVDVLRRHGIAWDGRVPKGVDEVRSGRFDLLITVCDDAAEDCPYFSGARARVHWGLADPAAETGPEAPRAFERTYQQVADRIDRLLALPLESMAPPELEHAVSTIHQSLQRSEAGGGCPPSTV